MQNNPQELSWQAIQAIVGVKLPPNVLRFDDIGFHLVNNTVSSAEDSDSDVEIVENDWESDNNVSSRPDHSDNEKTTSPDREQSCTNDVCKGSATSLKRDTSRDRTDLDIIRENHKFVWEEDDVADTWEKQLAKKYCDKLFKEYCICDLSRYKENKVALRWRIEKEVVLGKGQFQCGNKVCNKSDGLKSWEVNFAYMEDNERKNTLVKLRLCPGCSELLNYRSKKREVKRLKKGQKKSKKAKKPDKEESEDEEEELLFLGTPDEQVEPSTSAEAEATETDETSLWKKGLQEAEEKSREEEFEEYLEDLLL